MPPTGCVMKVKEATLNLSQAAATYDAITASGDVLIESVSFYVSVIGGGGLVSVAVQTNQTTVQQLLTAAEGAVANLLSQQTLAFAYAKLPMQLRTGHKIQYTIAGAGATGEIKMVVCYRPVSGGAML